MQNTITQQQYEGLNDEFKKEYAKDGEAFNLKIEGGPDIGALKRAKEHEKEARQKAEEKTRTVQDELTSVNDKIVEILKGAVPKNDVDALEKQYKEKSEKQKTEYETTISGLNGSLKSVLVDNKALEMATAISVSPELILPHIAKRLTTEVVDGKTVTRVLGADGKISATSLEELKTEFIKNDSFAKIIKASDGSGSGASGTNGGSANGKGNINKIDYAKASVKEKVEHIMAKRKAEGVTT